MATTTPNYSFQKPTVSGDSGVWGGYLNDNFTSLDSLLGGGTVVTGIDINSGTIDGATIGANSATSGVFTTVTVDNITIDGQQITSTNTNGNIQLFANGTGYVELYGNTNPGAVRFNCENNSHGVTLKGPAHSANATYSLELPDADGSAGTFLTTDGSGKLSFAAAGAGSVTSVAFSTGSTGLTSSGGPITTAGTITLGGTLAVANGGTNLTSLGSAGQVLAVNSGGSALEYVAASSGSVTSVGGTGTVSGLTLTGTVTSSGNLTLGGTLDDINLTSGVTGTLPIANGGTGSTSTTFVNLASNVIGVLPLANGGTGGTTALNLREEAELASGNDVQFQSLGVGTAGSTVAGEIRATNNITAYYSDDRLKTKLGLIEDALDKVNSLTGFYYEANETAQALGYEVKREVGVSAQEVEAIMPEVVAPAPIDDKYLTVRYEKLIPLLVQAIKELSDKVETLEAK